MSNKPQKAHPRPVRFEAETEEKIKELAEKDDRTIVDMTRVLVKRGIAVTEAGGHG